MESGNNIRSLYVNILKFPEYGQPVTINNMTRPGIMRYLYCRVRSVCFCVGCQPGILSRQITIEFDKDTTNYRLSSTTGSWKDIFECSKLDT